MLKNRGIALKLIILILASITVIFSFVLGYNYFFSRRIIIANIEKDAGHLALATVNHLDMVLRPVEKVPQNLAQFLGTFPYESGDIMSLVESVVEHNPEIYGATIAFEPYAYSATSLTFAPYFYKSGGKMEFTYIPYEYFDSDWYQIPKELDRPAWTEPYYDEGAGNIIMATYAVPFYRPGMGKREFLGVVTADISLDWLQEIVSSIKIGRTGYGFLISKNGTFVTHPDPNLVMNETIFSVAEARNDARMRALGREMVQGKSGFAPFRSLKTGKECWMVYAPLSANGWSLGVLFPKDELMADVATLNRTVLVISLIGLMFIVIVIVLIAGSITKPLRVLSRVAGIMGTGNLDIEIPPIKSGDEVGRLADSFNAMKGSLKKYISDLTETTAAKERIESELNIARDIQMGILHKIFPPFPHRHELDIWATLEPAKEVGGDLYDFFLMDEDHLCFAVGDVSGKGVPAALFMAIVMTLIKTKASESATADTILTRVNQALSSNNPSSMFVTLFLGILNIRTGEIEYSNGGHNPPYIIPAGGEIRPVETTHGMALGVMEDFPYQAKKLILQKGDSLFVYTDGVTEAMNAAEELFSSERLERDLTVLKEKPIQEVVAGIMEKIGIFSQGLEQTDDITMMMLTFSGK
ncbi:MAG: SpoIIE family protein phosphatase [Pseudomonadota bacterium]